MTIDEHEEIQMLMRRLRRYASGKAA